MKSGLFMSLLPLVALLFACSPKAPPPAEVAASPAAGPARFTLIPNDVAGIAEITTRQAPGSNAAFVVHIQFTDAKAALFRDFTRAHVNQRVQLVIGHEVVADTVIGGEVSNGQADISFATAREARTIMETLAKLKAGAPTAEAAAPHLTNSIIIRQ